MNISWTPGSDGGRADVYYEVSYKRGCAQCGGDCTAEERQLGTTTKPSYQFKALQLCEDYTFSVTAKNGVTQMAGGTNPPLVVHIYPGE